MGSRKKKRKRPYTPPDRATQDAGTEGVPERRERKDDVRRVKERDFKRWRRRRLARRTLTIGIVAAIVAVGVVFLAQRQAEKRSEFAGLIAQAGPATKVASCSPVEVVGSYLPAPTDGPEIAQSNPDGVHVQAIPRLSQYASSPPASGPMADFTFPAGVEQEAPDMGAVIHSIEHGAAVIWYSPDANKGSELKKIEEFVGANRDHTIMAPYEYPDEGAAGRLAGDTKMALASWHRVQECDELSLPVVAKFLSNYRYPTLGDYPYQGDAPEKGGVI